MIVGELGGGVVEPVGTHLQVGHHLGCEAARQRVRQEGVDDRLHIEVEHPVGQRGAHPAHAAIILSLETVFAAIGGVLLLGEHLDERAIVGCALMLAGMLISQIRLRWWWKSRRNKVSSQP